MFPEEKACAIRARKNKTQKFSAFFCIVSFYEMLWDNHSGCSVLIPETLRQLTFQGSELRILLNKGAVWEVFEAQKKRWLCPATGYEG